MSAPMWTRAQLLGAMREWERLYGYGPTSLEWRPATCRDRGLREMAERHEAGQWPTVAVVYRFFPTWQDALRAAGVKQRPSAVHERARQPDRRRRPGDRHRPGYRHRPKAPQQHACAAGCGELLRWGSPPGMCGFCAAGLVEAC